MVSIQQGRYIKATKRWRRPWGKTDTLNCPRVVKRTIFVFSPVSPNFLFSHFFWIIAHNLLTQLWALREWLKECLTRRVSPLTSLGWSRRSDGALMNGCAATIRTFIRGRKFAHKSGANCKANLFLAPRTFALRYTRWMKRRPELLNPSNPRTEFSHILRLCYFVWVWGYISCVLLRISNKDLVAHKPEFEVKTT